MSRPRRIGRRIGLFATWLLGLLVVVLVVAVVAFYQLSQVPSPTAQKQAQAYTITYSDGSPMYTGGTVSRRDVPLAKVPVYVRDAVLAAEDRGFYTEPGLSIRGTARAALNDISGGNAQGGSGITQQYVKNHYLTTSRTLTRKLKELAIAVKLDRDYSKDQILEWYLNSIFWGRDNYGIQAASQSYFHKDVSRLTVSEGAVLAGIIQSPNDYDPVTAKALAVQRWNYVLDGMVSTHKLTAPARAAMTFPKVYPPRAPTAGATGPTALIVAQVKSELDADGFKGSLNTDGLTIQTTIDKSAQTDAVNAVTKAYANVSARNHGKLRQALVAVNPANGAVLAYYGGKNDKTSQRDYVQNWVAPGSSFKPFTLAAVLKANLEGKKPAYAINSTVDGSQPYTVDGLSPIHNDPSDLQYSYPQSITSAMTKSLNTAFARLAHAVGPGEVAAAARAAGVPARTTRSAPDPGQPTLEDKSGHTSVSIGFGAYPYTVRPLDQAVSFATLADGGVEHDSYLVNKVTDYSGKVLFVHKDAGRRAFDAKVANDTTLAMEGVAEWSRLSLDNGRKTAAKTGTVDHGAGSSDAWMVGFTPQVSVASWAGTDGVNSIYSDSGAPMYGRNNPGSAWKYFLDSYLKGKPDADLPSKQMIGKGSNGSSAPAPTTQSAVTAPTQTTPTRTARSTGATTATPSPTAPSSSSAPSTPPSTRSTSVASTPAPSSALPSSSPPPVSTVSTPSVVTSTAGR